MGGRPYRSRTVLTQQYSYATGWAGQGDRTKRTTPMYSESDLQTAVDAKVLTPEAATAFRTHIASVRSAPGADEESFRLITGFNDIFVSVAAVILLVAVAWIGESIHKALAGAFVAASAWFLAEYFTRTRRMALPSIVLVLAFAGGVAATMIGFLVEYGEAIFGREPGDTVAGLLVGVGLMGLFDLRSEEHTSELQSLMRSSYAVFCLKKKKNYTKNHR